MGRQPCCDKVGLKKGPWTAEEDKKLVNFILTNGQCCWRALPKLAGLLRCGKSCRLRWTNYLRSDLKRGLLSEEEEKIVIDLHAQLGNRWSKIASHLPGRTDNEIKNHWNTHIKKKLKKMGIDPQTHKPIPTIDEQKEECSITKGEEKEEEITKVDDHAKEKEEIVNNNEFCIDEVPIIEPNEILVPSSTPSSSSSSSHSSKYFEDLLFDPYDHFEWPSGLWDEDLLNWDFLSGDSNTRQDINLGHDISNLDQDSWTFGLL